MSDDLYTRLAWLPVAPEDFGTRLTTLRDTASEPDLGGRLRRLAQAALDGDQLRKLGLTIERVKTAGASLAPLSPYRLAILSNATTDFVTTSFKATAARHGIDLDLHVGDFGSVIQEVLDGDSPLYRFAPDAILLAIDHHGLPFRSCPNRRDEMTAVVDAAASFVTRVREAVQANSRAVCIVQTVARPPETLFGSLDFALPGTMRTMIEATNRALAESLAGSRDLLLDVAGIAETVGLANWHDPALWNMGKIPFDPRFAPLYAEHLFRLIAAAQGRSRRVLALDLDNTVWGGIIGDDGVEGIAVGQGDAVAEAHLAVQRAALDLRERGIVLAVSSKNDEDKARVPFREHAGMLLREEHIAVMQVNWEDKASNIDVVARQLNLGLESVAFLDDNPMERDLVRRFLPAVAVPELPADPALFARTLLAAGYFESVAVTEEDITRADLYQRVAKRSEMQRQANNLDDYLASLNMAIFFRPFDAAGRARIAQLIAKSNQFNLTTRRYTEAEVAALEADPGTYCLQVRLADIFGDNGMISVIVVRKAVEGWPGAWEIDAWLMSCRVLKRRVEEAVLRQIAEGARAAGARQLVGVYRPTPRNGIVADHYTRLGFRRLDAEAGPDERYVLDLAEYNAPELPMAVR